MSHSDHSDGESDRAESVRCDPALPSAVQTTETYQVEDDTVFYDAQNPLAWVQTDATVELREMA